MADYQRRQIAYKVRVADIINCQYVKKEGWQPNSILVADKEVSRVNLIATVVTKPVQEFNYVYILLDDGTGKIAARSFDEKVNLSSVDIGDAVLVIGRPREYNNDRYVIPEIIRKIANPKWIDLRHLELKWLMINPAEQKNGGQKPSLAGQAYQLIKKYDSGDGAVYEQVVKDLNSDNAEELIEKLLKEGEIFEIKPGRLKVLE